MEDFAPVVKLVDTRDLKSRAAKAACRFDPGPGHHNGRQHVYAVHQLQEDHAQSFLPRCR